MNITAFKPTPKKIVFAVVGGILLTILGVFAVGIEISAGIDRGISFGWIGYIPFLILPGPLFAEWLQNMGMQNDVFLFVATYSIQILFTYLIVVMISIAKQKR